MLAKPKKRARDGEDDEAAGREDGRALEEDAEVSREEDRDEREEENEVIALILAMLAHYPGGKKHNQRRHGNRWRMGKARQARNIRGNGRRFGPRK